MNKPKQYFLIFISLLLSGFIVIFFTDVVFIKGTPVMRPDVGVSFIAKVTSIFSFTTGPKMDNIPLKMVAKGVYAAKKDNNTSYTLYKEGEVDWVEYTFNIKGKDIKIRVSKGQSPPFRESLEVMN